MGSASSKAWIIGKYLSIHQDLQSILSSSTHSTAPHPKPPATTKITDLSDNVKIVELLASEDKEPGARFLLCFPKEGSLPTQLLAEVGCLLYVRLHTTIPAPHVYAWSDETGHEYIAREYIEGERLSAVWPRYTEDQKQTMVEKLAKIMAEMLEVKFDKIGGIMPDGTLGPVPEQPSGLKGGGGSMLENFNTGPYATVEEYREIYYPKDPVHDAPIALVSEMVRGSKEMLTPAIHAELNTQTTLPSKPSSRFDEPFVLCHRNFSGRNILVRGTDIVGVIGWDFAGSYPLSKAFRTGPVIVIDFLNDKNRESVIWSERVMNLMGEALKEKGWKDDVVEWLVGVDHADKTVSDAVVEHPF